MSEEFDFSELRNYLQGQADLGGFEILLDEPWTLQRSLNKVPRSASVPVRAKPVISPQPDATVGPTLVMSSQPSNPVNPAPAPIEAKPAFDGIMPAPRPVRKVVSAFDSSDSLDSFYGIIANEAVYTGSQKIARYEGPEHPFLLLLLQAPHDEIAWGSFLQSPVGEMLKRLFASLNVNPETIGVTYFYKSSSTRSLPPLLETSLRKMLAKELSFIAPQVMVTLGKPLFHQIFGKGKKFEEMAGTDLDFNGIKTCALEDAFAMSGDKQLKWLTWKVHIPRSSYFKA